MPRRLRLTTQIRSAQAAAGGDLDDETLAKIAQSSVHSSPGGTPAPLKRRRHDGGGLLGDAVADSGRRSTGASASAVGGSELRPALAAATTADQPAAGDSLPPETDYTRQVEPGLLPPPASAAASHPDDTRGASSGGAPHEEVRATFGVRSSHASESPMPVTRSRDATEPATPSALPRTTNATGIGAMTRLRGAAASRSTPAARAVRTLAAAAVHSSRAAAAALGRGGDGDGSVPGDASVRPLLRSGVTEFSALAGAPLAPSSAADAALPSASFSSLHAGVTSAPSAAAAVAPAPVERARSPARASPLLQLRAERAIEALPLPASLALPVPPTVSDAAAALPTPGEVLASQNLRTNPDCASPALPAPPPFFTVTAAQHQANFVCEDRWFARYDDTAAPLGTGGSGPVVVGVCDGHGGAEAAAWVSDFLPRLILSHTRSKNTAAEVSAAVSAAFLHADKDFRKIVAAKAQRSTGSEYARTIMHGTCVVAALFRQIEGLWWAFYANCGDCRAISGSLRPPAGACPPDAAGGIADPLQRRIQHPSARLPLHSQRGETVSEDYRACAAAVARSAIVPETFEPGSSALESSPVSLVARALAERAAAQLLSPALSSPAAHNATWGAPDRSVDHNATWNVREIRGVQLRCRDPLPVRLSPRQPAGDGVEHAAVSRAFAEARRAWEAERVAAQTWHASRAAQAAGAPVPESETLAPLRPRASAAASEAAPPRRSSPRVELQRSRQPSSPTTVYRWMLLRGSPAAAPPQEPALADDLQRSLRVAGSLTVTRALGDFYVKDSQLSFPLIGPHCPYISAAPDVYATPLTSADRFIVLACDGVFDQTTSTQAVQIVAEALVDCERAMGAVHIAGPASSAVRVFNDTQVIDGLMSACDDDAPVRAQAEALQSLMLGQDVRVGFPLSRGVGGLPGAGAPAAVASSQAFAGLTPQWRGASPGAGFSQPWSQPSHSQQSAESGAGRGDRPPPLDVGGLVAAFAGSPAHRLVGHALHGSAKSLVSAAESSPGSIREALDVILRAPVGVGRPGDSSRSRRSLHDDLTAVVIVLPWHLFPAPGPHIPSATLLEDFSVAEVSIIMDAASAAASDAAVVVEAVVSVSGEPLQQLRPQKDEGSQALIEPRGAVSHGEAPDLASAGSLDEPELLQLPGTAPAASPPAPPSDVALPLQSRPQRPPPSNTMLAYFQRSNRTSVSETAAPASVAPVAALARSSSLEATVEPVAFDPVIQAAPMPSLAQPTVLAPASESQQAPLRLVDCPPACPAPLLQAAAAGSALGDPRGGRSAITKLPIELDDVIDDDSDDEPAQGGVPPFATASAGSLATAGRLSSQRPFAASAVQALGRGGTPRVSAVGAKRSRAQLLLNHRGGGGEGAQAAAVSVAKAPLQQRGGHADGFLPGGAAGRPAH